MPPKEGFFETRAAPSIGANLTGTLNALAAGVKAVVGAGTAFNTELSPGDVITFLDTAGQRQFYTIDTIADATNMVLCQDTRTVSAISTDFGLATMNSPFFVVRDEKNLTFPLQDPVLGRLSASGISDGYRMAAPSITANLIDSINPDEGIRINSIYMRNPFQQTGGASQFDLIFFQVNDGTDVETALSELGVNGRIWTVIENTETPVDIYIPPIAGTDGWGLSVGVVNSKLNQDDASQSVLADSLNARVSNVNVPASMTGLLLPLVIGVRFTYGLTITG